MFSSHGNLHANGLLIIRNGIFTKLWWLKTFKYYKSIQFTGAQMASPLLFDSNNLPTYMTQVTNSCAEHGILQAQVWALNYSVNVFFFS